MSTLEEIAVIARNHLGRDPKRDANCCELARAVLAMLPVVEAASAYVDDDSEHSVVRYVRLETRIKELRAFAQSETETERTEREHGS